MTLHAIGLVLAGLVVFRLIMLCLGVLAGARMQFYLALLQLGARGVPMWVLPSVQLGMAWQRNPRARSVLSIAREQRDVGAPMWFVAYGAVNRAITRLQQSVGLARLAALEARIVTRAALRYALFLTPAAKPATHNNGVL